MRGRVWPALLMTALLCGLFGCGRTENIREHALDDLTAVSISCAEMDRCYSYSFLMRRERDTWLFDADCFTQAFEAETQLKDVPVSSEIAERLLVLVEDNELIAHAESYSVGKRLLDAASDGSAYAMCLSFSDESQYVANGRQEALERFFYQLAEELAQCT